MSYVNCHIKKKSLKVMVRLTDELLRLPKENICELDVTRAPRYDVMPVGSGITCRYCDYLKVE